MRLGTQKNVLLASSCHSMNALSLQELQKAIPSEGLFRKSTPESPLPWLLSPKPLLLSRSEATYLERLGPLLTHFYEASQRLYHRSLKKKISPELAQLLDQGKPSWLLEAQHSPDQSTTTPRIIRPDLMWTEEGFRLTELDSVPGGLGITHWLNQLYAAKDWQVLGGEEGISTGFSALFPSQAQIKLLLSEESSDYREEMAFLTTSLGERFSLCSAEEELPRILTKLQTQEKENGEEDTPILPPNEVYYRFFELFDWPQLPALRELSSFSPFRQSITPPLKPHFEEKLWLALFWEPGLRTEWKKELRDAHLQSLKALIPPSLTLTPQSLPSQAVYPFLNAHSWQEVAQFSQKEREWVLKISGFHPQAWGARGVHIGHDLPTQEWASCLQKGLESYPTNPFILQKFIPSKTLEHPYYDKESGEVRLMKGRVRLCPYYFRVSPKETRLGGCLATIVPSNKKKIHGMQDAILVPCALEV